MRQAGPVSPPPALAFSEMDNICYGMKGKAITIPQLVRLAICSLDQHLDWLCHRSHAHRLPESDC